MLTLSILSLLFAAVPAYFYFRNVGVYQPLPGRPLPGAGEEPPAVSVLIPARDEEANIADCVGAVLANEPAELEVVVLDDHSTDNTAAIVERLAEGDPRVRLVPGSELPAGWNGKQHACWQLAAAARHDVLIFLDADVRLASDAIARIANRFASRVVPDPGGVESSAAGVEDDPARCARNQADLVSGFPRQITGSPLEHLLIPLIHFVLLGFLSLRRLRRTQSPAFAAGCGQLFATTKRAYEQSGGHRAIRSSRHDGIKLPRLYLAKGLSIDLFDATDLASVRMYTGARATCNGLSKNADEGVATPGLLPPVTAALALGQVAPLPLLGVALASGAMTASIVSAVAVCLSFAPRLDAAARFRQSWFGALLHPVGVLIFLAVQWSALVAKLRGRQVEWKGRPATSAT